jgi:hypothetical protein
MRFLAGPFCRGHQHPRDVRERAEELLGDSQVRKHLFRHTRHGGLSSGQGKHIGIFSSPYLSGSCTPWGIQRRTNVAFCFMPGVKPKQDLMLAHWNRKPSRADLCTIPWKITFTHFLEILLNFTGVIFI